MLKKFTAMFKKPHEHELIKNNSENRDKTIETISIKEGDLLINDEPFKIRDIRSIIVEAPDFKEFRKTDGERDAFIYMPRKRKNTEWAGGSVSQAFFLGTIKANEKVARYLRTQVKSAGIPVLEM